jgi:hypothetical protein
MNYLAKKHIFLEKGKIKPKKAVLRQAVGEHGRTMVAEPVEVLSNHLSKYSLFWFYFFFFKKNVFLCKVIHKT